jgi:hypothetical protein
MLNKKIIVFHQKKFEIFKKLLIKPFVGITHEIHINSGNFGSGEEK